MRTEPHDDGLRIIADTDEDYDKIATLMNGGPTQTIQLREFIGDYLGNAKLSGLEFPWDDNGRPDLISRYVTGEYTIRPFRLVKPRGVAIAVLYDNGSPHLKETIMNLLSLSPAYTEHKAYVLESIERITSEPIRVDPYPAVAARRKKTRKFKRKRRTTFRRKY